MPSKGSFSSTAFALLLASALPGRAMAAPPVHLLIQKGTPIALRLAHDISSADAYPGEPVDFVVIHDVKVNGFTVIRRGSTALGSVIRVRKDHPFGLPGDVTLQLDSVNLADGRPIQLTARQRFRGRSHLLRMSVKMVLTAAVYWPVAPLFLLSHGRESTVLAGTKITAHTVEPVSISRWHVIPATEGGLTLSDILQMLPSRATNYYGRPGDALNLVFWGTRADIDAAFTRAGWIVPDRPTPRIIWPLIRHRWHYKKLPIFNLYAFGRPEDMAFVLPNPRLIVEQRHHVRIWKTDYTLDGIPVWVGSATHDVSVQIVLRKLSIFHRINPDVDAERNFIGRDLAKVWYPIREQYIPAAKPVYAAKTATGQAYRTDGRMLFVNLMAGQTLVAATPGTPTPGTAFQTAHSTPPPVPAAQQALDSANR